MIRPLAIAAGVAAAGCGDVVEATDAGPPGDDAAPPGTDAARPAPDAAPPAPDAATGPVWIVVDDVTTGLLIGPYAGSDVDGVDWTCAGASGHGGEVAERRAGEAAGAAERALGAADGPCDPPDMCAASLGAGGWIALAADVPSLSGCEVTVHEVADAPGEAFEVWVCPGPELAAGCDGPLFRGGDGEGARGIVP
jgi:hypothetical protein